MSLARVRAERRRELEGAWVGPDVHGLDGVQFKVRGWDNPKTNLLRDKLNRAIPKERLVPNRDVPPYTDEPNAEDRESILTELMLETILLDWDGPGMAEEDGADPVPYSYDAAKDILTDPLLVPVRRAVITAAAHVAKSGRASIEADAKN